MGPAKFEFGSDFDGARECLCAVLDYVHLCGGGNGGFAGFGNHPCDVGGLLLLCESALLGGWCGCGQTRGVVVRERVVVISLFVFWATPRKKTKTSAAQGDYAWLCQPATSIRPTNYNFSSPTRKLRTNSISSR
jgi:hypothetical protein